MRTAVTLSIVALVLALGCAKKDEMQPATASTPTTSASGTAEQPAPPPPPPAGTAGTNTNGPPAAPTDTPAVAGGDQLTIGKPAPDFTAHDQNGKPVRLADYRGKPIVVYFYPKDETPGCTKEACAFRDAWNDLAKRGVVLIGVSTDTDESHKKFAEHHKLPFLLVSDPKGEIAAKFGVPVQNGYDKRESFVIGPDGNVRKIYREVDVSHHADEISQDVR